METQNRGFNSLYFILIMFLAMLITSLLAPDHIQSSLQKWVFTVGVLIYIGGSTLRVVQKTKKVPQNKSIAVQALGTVVATLAMLSGLIW